MIFLKKNPQSVHAASQDSKGKEGFQYKCLWSGCKVFGKGSSSKTWLEKHVLTHGGNKPFQCIVDGCKMRFGTQSLLERHVNNHFKATSANGAAGSGTGSDPCSASSSSPFSSSHSGQSGQSGFWGMRSARKSIVEPEAVKAIRKAGKRLKFRKTIFSARIFDLFDVGVMARLQGNLTKMHSVAKDDLWMEEEDKIVFKSQIVGKKRVPSAGGTKGANNKDTMVLLRWRPENM